MLTLIEEPSLLPFGLVHICYESISLNEGDHCWWWCNSPNSRARSHSPFHWVTKIIMMLLKKDVVFPDRLRNVILKRRKRSWFFKEKSMLNYSRTLQAVNSPARTKIDSRWKVTSSKTVESFESPSSHSQLTNLLLVLVSTIFPNYRVWKSKLRTFTTVLNHQVEKETCRTFQVMYGDLKQKALWYIMSGGETANS